MKLTNAVIFEIGTHNGQSFSVEDLNAVVESFEPLHLGGRIPLKLGHEGPDVRDDPTTQFALGWADHVRRDGTRLIADLDVSDATAELIKSGALRFMSIELLRNAKDSNGKTWPLVLDAIALLGRDRPAVENVSDLRALAASRQAPAFTSSQRVVFSRESSEADKLREQLNKANAALISMTFENAITAGRIRPAEREIFAKRFGQAGTLEDAQQWISSAPKPATYGRTTLMTPVDGVISGRPDDSMIALTKKIIERERAKGDRLDFSKACMLAVKENPEAARSWLLQNGEV